MIKPAFSSWEHFLTMGGYGFYVWWSLAITVLVLAVLYWLSIACHQRQKAAALRYWQRQTSENPPTVSLIIEESPSEKP